MPAPTKETGILTVATIREAKGRILFNEREQIFALPETKARDEVSRRLYEALERKLPVRALLDPRRGLVQKIEPLSEGEIEEFRRTLPLLERPEKVVRIDVADIDPTRFNVVEAQESAACSANAHVSTYSIQPGSAYTPMFTTDPAYTHTNQTLIDYQNLTTC